MTDFAPPWGVLARRGAQARIPISCLLSLRFDSGRHPLTATQADDATMSGDHGRPGFVLLEVIATLVVLGVLLVLAVWWNQRAPSAVAVAQLLARIVTVTRWSAIQDGNPRVLLASNSGKELSEVRGAFGCDTRVSDRRVIWSAQGTRLTWPSMGLAFAPDGRPRRCDGSAVGNTTILIEGPRGDRAAVIVASLGRVRWERR